MSFPSGELHPSNGGAGCQGTWCSGDGFRGERDARALRSCDGRHQGTCASLARERWAWRRWLAWPIASGEAATRPDDRRDALVDARTCCAGKRTCRWQMLACRRETEQHRRGLAALVAAQEQPSRPVNYIPPMGGRVARGRGAAAMDFAGNVMHARCGLATEGIRVHARHLRRALGVEAVACLANCQR